MKHPDYHYKTVLILILSILMVNYTSSQEKQVKIAMAQIFCLDGDRSGNLLRIENAIREAKENGAEIVTFPEASILGWVNPTAHQRANPIPGKDSDHMCELADKYNIYVSIGLAEKEGENLFDSVILIDPDGKIILKHRKMNILTELMDPPYTPGRDITVAETSFGKAGLLICADSFKEEILQRMKELEPDILFIPYGWAAEETAWPEHGKELLKVVQKTARVNGCTVIGTDLVGEISQGPWTGLVYGGQSVACDKNGTILGLCKDRERHVLVLTVELPGKE